MNPAVDKSTDVPQVVVEKKPEAVRFGVAACQAAVMTESTELCRQQDAERLFGKIVSDGGQDAHHMLSLLDRPFVSDLAPSMTTVLVRS